MKTSIKVLGLAFAIGLAIPAAAQASPQSDALSACMIKAASPEDHLVLMEWIFSLISRHPRVSGMVSISDARYEQINKASGELFTRLLTESCPAETSAAVRADGAAAISASFSALGEAAMTDLMGDPNVMNGVAGMVPYIDQNKLIGVLSGGQ